MDWQILRILLYSAFAAVAILLIYFGVYLGVPTASQFWGLERNADPVVAAEVAYERGDFSFLTVQFDWQGENLENWIPGIAGCWNHPSGNAIPLRENATLSIDDSASRELLFDFALAYNITLAQLMNEENFAGCTIVRTF